MGRWFNRKAREDEAIAKKTAEEKARDLQQQKRAEDRAKFAEWNRQQMEDEILKVDGRKCPHCKKGKIGVTFLNTVPKGSWDEEPRPSAFVIGCDTCEARVREQFPNPAKAGVRSARDLRKKAFGIIMNWRAYKAQKIADLMMEA